MLRHPLAGLHLFEHLPDGWTRLQPRDRQDTATP